MTSEKESGISTKEKLQKIRQERQAKFRKEIDDIISSYHQKSVEDNTEVRKFSSFFHKNRE